MNEYEFENRLETKDFLGFAAIHLFNPIIQVLYIAVAFLLAFVFRSIFPGLSVLLAGLGIYWLMLFFQYILTVRFLMKNHHQLITVLGYQKTGVNEEKYIEYYQSSVSEIKWNQFIKIKEWKKYFILNYIGKRFIILPKKLLPDGCAELIRQMAANLKERGAQKGEAPSGEEESGIRGDDFDGGVEVYRKPADLIAFQFYHSYVRRKFFTIMTAFIMILIIFITFLSSFTGEYMAPLLLFIALVASHLLTFLVHVISGRACGKKPYRIVYRFTDEGCEAAHKFGTNFLEWNKFYLVKQTAKYIFLYIGKNHAYVLPKRYLSPDTIQFLNVLVRRYRLNLEKPKRERMTVNA